MIRSNHLALIVITGLILASYYAVVGVPVVWLLGTSIVYFAMSCLGITITFHRYLTHNSFKFKWNWMEKLFILFGSLAGTGSAIGWVAVHRAHHLHSDRKGDPHGPSTGWKNFFNDYDQAVDYNLVKLLIKDPFLKFLHRRGLWMMIAFYLVLFIIGGSLALVFMGVLPQALTIIVSTVSNYFTHMYGYRTYNTEDDSKNNWWLSAITWGESWHNNHHAYPGRYSFKHKWWEFDISGSIISLIKE